MRLYRNSAINGLINKLLYVTDCNCNIIVHHIPSWTLKAVDALLHIHWDSTVRRVEEEEKQPWFSGVSLFFPETFRTIDRLWKQQSSPSFVKHSTRVIIDGLYPVIKAKAILESPAASCSLDSFGLCRGRGSATWLHLPCRWTRNAAHLQFWGKACARAALKVKHAIALLARVWLFEHRAISCAHVVFSRIIRLY